MKILNAIALIISCLATTVSFGQAASEANEPTPEDLDAAFTSEDAAREATRWSKVIIPPDRRTALERMTEEADLIFHGTVQSQQVIYGGNDIPFTHTTFAITDLIKGEADGGFFTLVQEGGPDKLIPHKVLLVSTSQYFSVSEEELLFIGFDQATDTDTVQQRFRVLQGNMYNENGRGVIVEQHSADSRAGLRLTRGRDPDKRFRTVPLGSGALYKQFGDNRTDTDDGPGGPLRAVSAGASSLGSSVGDFISAVSQARRVQQ